MSISHLRSLVWALPASIPLVSNGSQVFHFLRVLPALPVKSSGLFPLQTWLGILPSLGHQVFPQSVLILLWHSDLLVLLSLALLAPPTIVFAIPTLGYDSTQSSRLFLDHLPALNQVKWFSTSLAAFVLLLLISARIDFCCSLTLISIVFGADISFSSYSLSLYYPLFWLVVIIIFTFCYFSQPVLVITQSSILTLHTFFLEGFWRIYFLLCSSATLEHFVQSR